MNGKKKTDLIILVLFIIGVVSINTQIEPSLYILLSENRSFSEDNSFIFSEDNSFIDKISTPNSIPELISENDANSGNTRYLSFDYQSRFRDQKEINILGWKYKWYSEIIK